MAKYQSLPTTVIQNQHTLLHLHHLPELVHLDDPALSIMIDFTKVPPHTIHATQTIDDAIAEMRATGTHLLLVINNAGFFQGIVSSEDVWGEKPIQLINERRVDRDQIQVKMIMSPQFDITVLNFHTIESARVGHVVKTLAENRKHYALVVEPNGDNDTKIIRGIFNASQISKQLHHDLSGIINGTESLSDIS